MAVPPTNDVDVFAHDLGYIAIVNECGELAGFNVTVGGGMGITYGNKKTFPSTARTLGFITLEQVNIVAEKIMVLQRDNGNRAECVISYLIVHPTDRHLCAAERTLA